MFSPMTFICIQQRFASFLPLNPNGGVVQEDLWIKAKLIFPLTWQKPEAWRFDGKATTRPNMLEHHLHVELLAYAKSAQRFFLWYKDPWLIPSLSTKTSLLVLIQAFPHQLNHYLMISSCWWALELGVLIHLIAGLQEKRYNQKTILITLKFEHQVQTKINSNSQHQWHRIRALLQITNFFDLVHFSNFKATSLYFPLSMA